MVDNPYQLSSICLPSGNLVFTGHSKVDRIDHDTVARWRCAWLLGSIRRFQEALVVRRVVLFMESSRQTKVGKFDMSLSINKNIVWLDVSGISIVSMVCLSTRVPDTPVDETKFVNSFDGKYTLGHIEACYIFGKCVVLD